VKDQIREHYSLICEVNNIDSNDDNDDLYTESQKRLTKKLCKKSSREFIDFSEYYDSSDNEDSLDEIDQYLAYKKDHEKEYPKLSILCAFYLSILASSASSEREFSAAGLTINEQRTNLNSETLESILIMHSALK
ncbi:5222_t:CDS:2, partial [Cetraspora pellucida]